MALADQGRGEATSGLGLRFLDCTSGPGEDDAHVLSRLGLRSTEVLSSEVFYDPERLDAAAARAVAERIVASGQVPISAIPASVSLHARPCVVQAIALPSGSSASRDPHGRFSVAGSVVSTAVLTAAGGGDIVAQSEDVLAQLSDILTENGTSFDDVVKFNIYYQGTGTAEDWERAATVRARCFREPGPAATGVPVPKFEDPDISIGMQVLAIRGSRDSRVHSWPEGHWDWPIHLPYKHGCRIEDLVFIGGQVPLSANAEPIHSEDFGAQVSRSLDYIDAVLDELVVPRSAVQRLTAFMAVGPDNAAARLEALTEHVNARFGTPAPALIPVPMPFLAYQDMNVEIEVEARLDPHERTQR